MTRQTFSIYIPLLLFLLISVQAFSQETTVQDTTQIPIEIIKVTEINERVDIISKEYRRIVALVNDRKEFLQSDSAYRDGVESYRELKQDLEENLSTATLRSAENKLREWKSYQTLVDRHKTIIDGRIVTLNKEYTDMIEEEKVWDATRQNLIDLNTTAELINNVSTIIDSLQNLHKLLQGEIELAFGLQSGLYELMQNIEDDIDLINGTKDELKSSFFIRDSDAIWYAQDSTFGITSFHEGASKGLTENWDLIELTLNTNPLESIIFLCLFFLILILFYLMYRYRSYVDDIEEDYGRRARFIIRRFILSSLCLSLVLIMVLFTDLPAILNDLATLILLMPIIVLVPRMASKYIRSIIYLIVVLFLIDKLDIVLTAQTLINRIFILFQIILLIWVFIKLYRWPKNLDQKVLRFHRYVSKISPLFILILAVSLILNIVGYSRFSNYLVSAIIRILIAGFVIYLVMIILQTVVLFLLQLSKSRGLSDERLEKIRRRFYRLINVFGLILWFRSALISFTFLEPLLDFYESLMDSTVNIRTVEISVGGIISFIIIILITFFLARGIKQLFNQPWMEKTKLPKGLPGAISMVTRYIIVAFGVYIALTAAGVDLSRFGLLAGALGVGIGFGLQNVVYNFISGLIISFERPINVGDTVEVGTLMGVVTEVGVRASKVKTFDGSEVIVPNGNIISKEVINWTLSDQKRRLKLQIKTVLNADPRVVLKILHEQAEKHPNTLKNPAPMALFNGYMDTSLDFTIYFWVYFNASFITRSDVALGIHDSLKEHGIALPIPLQKLYYDKDNPLEEFNTPPEDKD